MLGDGAEKKKSNYQELIQSNPTSLSKQKGKGTHMHKLINVNMVNDQNGFMGMYLLSTFLCNMILVIRKLFSRLNANCW